jgi:hypothetical protein
MFDSSPPEQYSARLSALLGKKQRRLRIPLPATKRLRLQPFDNWKGLIVAILSLYN